MARLFTLFLAGCALVTGCRRETPGVPATGQSAAPSVGGPSASAPAPLLPPVTLRGSSIALTPDEATLVVADEDHEALFLLPSALTETSTARVVPLPGPPGQVVAFGDRVLVAVRTLPTAASRAARDKIRGPVPAATNVAVSRGEPWAAAVPSALAALNAAEGPPKPTKNPARAAAIASSRVSRAERRANEEYSRKRARNTPPAIFDPSVVRESQGGLLLAFRRDAAAGLVEIGRSVLPPDAWGLAVTSDQRQALVTSPWSAQVSLVELDGMRVVASVATRREPRGIALTPDGKRAYVSHLVGSSLSELELGKAALGAKELPFSPAVARAPTGVTLEASLSYDLVLSPDAETLFVPRHALGAEGVGSWWGAPTVDALDLASGKPLAPAHGAKLAARLSDDSLRPSADWEPSVGQAPAPRLELVQPRSVVYRKTRDTLLVASEGADALTELDALAPDPSMAVVQVFKLATSHDVYGDFADRGGGPAGVALSRDEHFAYVYCRTTFDVVRVDLEQKTKAIVHLTDDGLPADAAYGRRLFANASSDALSGGLGCAACHPEGRDDAYVWREGDVGSNGPELHFIGRRENVKLRGPNDPVARRPVPPFYPRQTPMLAGRVRANGPFGWHAESEDIVKRLMLGTQLHRAGWQGTGITREYGEHMAKLDYLADYLRSGLLPPPTLVSAFDATLQRGKAIFESDEARCSRCHLPQSEFTDRLALPLPTLPTRPGFGPEANPAFKTPSLWFIAGTAPYFHDGSQATLEDLVRTNGDRMGKTSHLSADDQAALVAYLRTL